VFNKKLFTAILILLFSVELSFSQTVLENQRDSLKSLLNKSSGIKKVDLLNELSMTLYRLNPQQSLAYADSAQTLAAVIKYSKGELDALIHKGSANFFMGNYEITYEMYREAEQIIARSETPVERSNILYRLAIVQRKRGFFDESLELAEQSLKISRSNQDTVSVAKTLNVIGLILWNMERFDEAIEVYIETQKIVKDKYPKRYAMALTNMALIYDQIGEHRRAIELNLEALPIKEKRGDLRGIRNSFNNIALSYKKLGELQKSLDYQYRALELDKKMNNKMEMARAMDNIGITYLELNRPLDAKPFIEESYEIRKYQPDNYDFAEITKNMGILNYKLKNYNKAEEYLQEAVRISEACECIEKHAMSYKHLSELFKAKGNYKNALKYNVLYHTYSDSIVNENVRNQISKLEKKYETEKKEQEIVLLNKEKELQAASLVNEKLLRNSILGGTFTLLIIAVGLYNRYRYKAKTNKKLSELNNQLTDLNNHMEDELNQAASYVQSLLPSKLNDKIKTDWMFIPSSQLGGDSFGHSWLSENLFSFYLIDVSGHGVGAALLSTTVLNLLKTKTLPEADFSDPASVLNSLNRNFDMEEHEGKYFAIWYGVVDVKTKELSCASAMHPPALSINRDGITKLGKKDIMIGAFPEYEYNNAYYQLSGGEKVYLFSDGCFEIGSEHDNALEFEDFTKIIHKNSKASNPLENIFSELSTINMSENFGDDYSIIELEIQN
jgi:serine phosphatase RsbU (regulator of sigma subunit)